MDHIRRIKPQSKRKAINAKAFVVRYIDAANAAREDGNVEEANKLLTKAAYWTERWNHHDAAYRRGLKRDA